MIPIARPTISDDDVRTVTDAVASGWVSSAGVYLERFESLFAEYCGVRHCVSTANGTVAIHLALHAMGIGEGDEVIVPDLTFVATANAVMHSRATPVMVDVDRDTWCIDPAAVEAAITSRTKAIMPVHLYGHPCAMDELQAIASGHGLQIIEDAAEAHGAEYKGRRVGGLGDCATFSFYGNKIITTGEGGAITTNSDEIADRARLLRDHGMSRTRRYYHTEVGYNYRMTNMQAALGVSQFSQIGAFLDERDRILEAYRRHLGPEGFEINPHADGTRPVNWMTCTVLAGVDRDQRDAVIAEMKANNVEARPFFFPVTAMPMYAGRDNSVAATLSGSGLNLPTYPSLSDGDVAIVCRELLAAVEKAGPGKSAGAKAGRISSHGAVVASDSNI